MKDFLEILNHTLLISGFVFSMMLFIEYLNVLTKGEWQKKLKRNKFGQIILGVLFGIVPGCLGSFTIVSLYSHGVVSFGALTATMIASTGDEAYVMFSAIPKEALLITGIIAVVGFVTGFIVDKISLKISFLEKIAHGFELHEEEHCDCSPTWTNLKRNFSTISFPRALLVVLLTLLFLFTAAGTIAGEEEQWVRITLAIVTLAALYVVVVVPEHFLEDHLWKHVLKKHLLRIFIWTFAALAFIHFIEAYVNLHSLIEDNYFIVLIIAVLIGIIPESGPHLVFISLFASGSLPLGILLASSIVQDGHGTLPLLAFSKKGFIWVKLINVIVGFFIGTIFFYFAL
jgi:uncharacterized membrane protein YuzA (DUF378 family)